MRYLGGKTRLAPWLLPILENARDSLEQWYIEPFCGGCNVIDKMEGKRIGIDSNRWVIAMWKALQNGWIPPKNITNEQYNLINNNKEKYKVHVVGFVGINSSFGGKWWGGYARSRTSNRNYTEQGHNVVLSQIATMKDVKFHCLDTLKIKDFPARSLIYCDPPYEGTTKYKDAVDSKLFWEWIEMMYKRGHKVFVSEKQAPIEWKCVMEKQTNNNLNSKILVERLWTKDLA